MRHLYTTASLFFLICSGVAKAGEWKRVSEDVLSFSGVIEEKVELQKLIENWDDKIKTLIVNSPGGHTATGVRMGVFLLNKTFDIEVRGECMSSCANYLFSAAQKKDLREGVVGFHGNATAAYYNLNDAMYFHTIEQFTEDDFALLQKFFAKNSRKKLREDYVDYGLAAEEEEKFLAQLGISQELFTRSQLIDKGMRDGRMRSFLLPTSETFKMYGFKNIIGEQNREVLRTHPVFSANAEDGFDVVID